MTQFRVRVTSEAYPGGLIGPERYFNYASANYDAFIKSRDPQTRMTYVEKLTACGFRPAEWRPVNTHLGLGARRTA